MFHNKQGLFVSMALLVCVMMHTVSATHVDTCPEVVLHTCDQLSKGYDESVVQKCKKGMHILWKRGTFKAKQELNIAAIVEDFYEHQDENKLPIYMRMGCFRDKNGQCNLPQTSRRDGKRTCTGAKAVKVACRVATVALTVLTRGAAALLGLGCDTGDAVVDAIC